MYFVTAMYLSTVYGRMDLILPVRPNQIKAKKSGMPQRGRRVDQKRHRSSIDRPIRIREKKDVELLGATLLRVAYYLLHYCLLTIVTVIVIVGH